MSVKPDLELDRWRREWQAQNLTPVNLRARVDREIRRQRFGFILAMLVTVGFGVAVPAWAVASRRPDVAVLAVAVWLFIGINWAVASWLGRDLSRPPAETTAAFLEFAILSCHRRRQAIVAASVLYVAMFAFNLAWIYQAQPIPAGAWAFLSSGGLMVAYGVTVALGAIAFWLRNRLRHELDNLVALRQSLTSKGETPVQGDNEHEG